MSMVFEVESTWRSIEEPETGGTVSRYFRAESPAVKAARSGEPEDLTVLGIPAGCIVIATTVYGCEVNDTTPRETLIGLLNGDVFARRTRIVYGDLPLPLCSK